MDVRGKLPKALSVNERGPPVDILQVQLTHGLVVPYESRTRHLKISQHFFIPRYLKSV
jgi:hypothetical protein